MKLSQKGCEVWRVWLCYFFQKCSFVVFTLVMFLLPLYTLYPEIFASTKIWGFRLWPAREYDSFHFCYFGFLH